MRLPTTILAALLLSAALCEAQYLTVKGSLPLTPRQDAAIFGNLAYTVGANSFSIVSFASPNSPTVVGQVAPGAATLSGVALRGDFAYCAGQNNGIVVINVDNTSAPVWERNVLAAAPIEHVAVSDTFLAAATGLNVTLFGLSNPSQPHLLTAYGRPANRVAIDANNRKIHCAGNDGAFVLSWQVNQGNVSLSEADEFGSAEYTSVALGEEYVNVAQGLQFSALHVNNYTLAGQYGAAGQIKGVASGTNFSVIGLATGGVEYLRQTGDTPQFVSSAQATGGVNSVGVSANGQFVIASTTAGMTVMENSAVAAGERPELPGDLALSAYPNPFNPVTTISWAAPLRESAVLTVTNALGREVLRFPAGAAAVSASLDFSGLSAGSYFVRLNTSAQPRPLRVVYLP